MLVRQSMLVFSPVVKVVQLLPFLCQNFALEVQLLLLMLGQFVKLLDGEVAEFGRTGRVNVFQVGNHGVRGFDIRVVRFHRRTD